ncbi:uncharacterized protein LOC132788134 [Drosophila nasuta]|uniref:uncharacterized protein LOC132788134 n=1 Tax=Drosophila nasuta TaxID=42062 RepID=UPI00295EB55B|nr:uncharacterized protein LOC132788134 [Drosophila nasuta]
MRKLQVFIGWFQALNGITEYYPDAQTGSLKRSKYMKFYIIFHNLLTLSGTSLLFNDLLAKRSSAVYAVHSHWITYAAMFYTIVKILVIFLTLHSVLVINLICLQLSCQSTEIHVFGVFTLNKRLWFVVITEVLLNIIYMVQNDYHFFM